MCPDQRIPLAQPLVPTRDIVSHAAVPVSEPDTRSSSDRHQTLTDAADSRRGKWKLNLQAGRPERIRLRGRDVLARPELVGDIDEIERLLAVMTAANPRVSSFVAIPKGPDGRLDRARLQTAVKYGLRVVRWHLDQPEASVP
jgi:hypothetical protein